MTLQPSSPGTYKMKVLQSAWSGTLALVTAVLIAAACSDGSPTPLLSPQGPNLNVSDVKRITTAKTSARSTSSNRIGEAGGTILIEGGHSLYFPPGSLPQATDITAERVEGTYIQVKFGPHGIRFPADRQPVLTLNWSTAENPDPSRMLVAYVDAAGTILEQYPGTIDTAAQTIRVKLDHFSAFAAAQ